MAISQHKLPACRQCPYRDHPFVPPEGALDAEVMFIGDSPWRTEVERHRPLVGPAGQVYNALLECADLERREVYTTNVVKCQPDQLGEAYPRGVVELCTQLFLHKELARVKPRLIVPMGNSALKALKVKAPITSVRGIVQRLEVGDETYTMLPTFHPSFILRKPAYTPYSEQDMQALRYFLDNGASQPENADLDYKAVLTRHDFRTFFREFDRAKYVACDVETTGLDYRSDTLLSVQFSFKARTGYCLPMYHLPYGEHGGERPAWIMRTLQQPLLHKLREYFYNPAKTFFFHNGKFDLRMLHHFFLKNLGTGLLIDAVRWWDTQAMYGLLNENTSQSLKEIAKLHTDLRYSAKELATVKGGQMKKMTLEELVTYGVKDVDATRRLGIKFYKELKEQNLLGIYHVHQASDMKVANVLWKMEVFGAPIDRSKISELERFMGHKLTFYERRMQRVVGRQFNPNSTDQLRDVLYGDLHFPIPDKKTPGGKPSTDKEVISGLTTKYPKNKFLKYFRLHRDYSTIEKTFVRGFEKKLDVDGRLHPDFGFTRTVSGRVVCYNPNLANIPRDREFEEGVFVSIRSLFAVPDTHRIVYADAAQIEFKTAAILSKDKKLIHALFVDRADFHDLVARALYPKYEDTLRRHAEAKAKLAQGVSAKLEEKLREEMLSCEIILKLGRTRSKNFNFGRIYGAQLPTLAAALGTTIEKVEPFIRRLAKRYPRFEAFLKETPDTAIREGELINPYNRRRRFPPTLDERVESEQARQGGNFLPQSSAAYVIRAALVRIAQDFERVGMNSFPFNIVYDSIICESPKDEVKDAAEIMCRELLMPVPELDNHSFAIECGVGQSWQQAEKAAIKIYSLEDFRTLSII